MSNRYNLRDELPRGELAPGLILAGPEELDELLATGENVSHQDFMNACDALRVYRPNGSRAFNRICGHLALGAENKVQLDLRYWLYHCVQPQDGVRNYLAVATQRLANMVTAHEAKRFDMDHELLSDNGWTIAAEVLRDEGGDTWAEPFTGAAAVANPVYLR